MSKAIVWFRQDLRISDNPALAAACFRHDFIIPIYILDEVTPLGGAQRWWLHHSLASLEGGLKKMGLNLCRRQGKALDILTKLVQDHGIEAIYWNRCYEPDAIERDILIKQRLKTNGVRIASFNGNLLHEPWQITNTSGHFFKVFTPYWRACLKQMSIPKPHQISRIPEGLVVSSEPLTSWKLLPSHPNWAKSFGDYWQPGEEGALVKLANFIDTNLKGYGTSRDVPAKDATSKLSPHLHFGEISPWQVWRAIEEAALDKDGNLKSIERFLSEIGWREFSYHLLYHAPSLPNTNFKSMFDSFPWKNDAMSLKRSTRYDGIPYYRRWDEGVMANRLYA